MALNRNEWYLTWYATIRSAEFQRATPHTIMSIGDH
jgi:hypothetical protein